MTLTKVTRNYQITLPKDVREDMEIKIGDTMLIQKEQDQIKMKKFTRNILEKSFGSWKNVNSIEFVRNIRDESEERLRKLGL